MAEPDFYPAGPEEVLIRRAPQRVGVRIRAFPGRQGKVDGHGTGWRHSQSVAAITWQPPDLASFAAEGETSVI